MLDETKRRRRGPAPLDAADKRRHSVSVRLNDAELARLDALREPVHMQRGEYLRAAALHRLPPSIPAVNRQAWAELARTAANLNQLAHRLNAGETLALAEVRAAVDELRRRLIGVGHDLEERQDESQD